MTIDLRSDTVTRPSPAMRQAMAAAEVDDDVLGADPTVNRLQEVAAELLGKETAIYVPSGTMANQIAVRAQTQRGDEVFVHAQAHLMVYEQAATTLSNVALRCFDSPDGTLDIDAMESYLHDATNVHFAPTSLVCLENTNTHCGGAVLPREHAAAVGAFCRQHGLRLHLDGARLINAAAASGATPAELAAPCDTVSLCLSKGLGAPIGSVLAGDEATIALARRARKIYGGGMRQAGVIAAAGLYAIEHNLERPGDDNRRARRLAEAVAEMPGLAVDLDRVQSNIVLIDTEASGLAAATLVERLAAAGVLALAEGRFLLRFVTHLEIDDVDVEQALKALVAALHQPQ